MKTKLTPAILIYLLLAIAMQGCGDDPKKVVIVDEFRGKPASQTKVLGRVETTGIIEIQPNNWQNVLEIAGPGSFISAIVSQNGGDSKDFSKRTTVKLWLDDREVLRKSFEVVRAMGLSEQNYSGIVWFEGEDGDGDKVETLVLGYSQPLIFSRATKLKIKIDDPDVKKVFLSMTYTRKDAGDDEPTGGGDGDAEYP